MKILGIETATANCSAAIIKNNKVLIERSIDSPQMHSEKLISLIDGCFSGALSELQALDGIAVSIGPGSFTGLRIGLSVAKGLAYSSGKPLMGIPTLEALAWSVVYKEIIKEEGIILPLLDARRDEVYFAAYRYNGGEMEKIIPFRVGTVKDVSIQVPQGSPVYALGDGAEKFFKYLQDKEFNKLSSYIIPNPEMRVCNAVSVALEGEKKLLRGENENIVALEPMYVKDFYTIIKTQHQKETA